MRIRIEAVVGFIISCLVSLFLGFGHVSFNNDKFLHFSMFFIMTGFFYWIFDTNALKHSRISTFVVCTLIMGIASEFVQGLLPYREFDYDDIIANITGSLSALILSILAHKVVLKSRKEERLRRVQATWVDLERADIAFSDDEYDDMDNTPIPEIPLYSLKSKAGGNTTSTATTSPHGTRSNNYNEPVTPSDTSENYAVSPVISPTTPVLSHMDP